MIRTILRILKRLATPRRWRSKNELKTIYRSQFSGPGGEIVINDLAEKFHLGTPIVNNPIQEGERNVVLYILSMIHLPMDEEVEEEKTGERAQG